MTTKESQPTHLTFEAKDLMRPDFDDPLNRREQMAAEMRAENRKNILSKKRTALASLHRVIETDPP
jgi:hypothetical protein